MAERVEKPSEEGLSQSAAPSEETYKTPDPRPHYLELDGLRGIAILIVVMAHATAFWYKMTDRPLYVPLLGLDLVSVLVLGPIAICLFFLLSGYLLTWTEERRERRGSYSLLNYAKRRALRLVPAYYVAIAVVILAWPTDPSFWSVALHLTFLQNFKLSYPEGLDPAFWVLTSEVAFYAMMPFFLLKFRKLWQRAMILALLVVVSLATRLLWEHDVFGILTALNEVVNADRIVTLPTTFLYLFLVGMLLRMMVERRIDATGKPSYRQLFAASALTVIPVAVVLPLMFPYLFRQQLWPGNTVFFIVEAMAILIFASVLLGSPVLKPVLRWRPLVFFGMISYSLFLLHTTVIITMTAYIRPVVRPWLRHQDELMVWVAFGTYASIVLGVAGALAYLSYRYVESPFLRIKPK